MYFNSRHTSGGRAGNEDSLGCKLCEISRFEVKMDTLEKEIMVNKNCGLLSTRTYSKNTNSCSSPHYLCSKCGYVYFSISFPYASLFLLPTPAVNFLSPLLCLAYVYD